MAARHEEGCYEKINLKHFHVCKELLNDGRRDGEAHRISGDTAGIIKAGFKTGDFVKEKGVGGLP